MLVLFGTETSAKFHYNVQRLTSLSAAIISTGSNGSRPAMGEQGVERISGPVEINNGEIYKVMITD